MTSFAYTGSCLCGSVSYEIRGDAKSFFHCHCKRCRKATGTGHASNIIIVNPESAKWLSGEDLLRSYRVAEAKRFRNVFCSACGSPMPRFAPDLKLAVIPAGTLDSAPPLAPTARIFCDSRAEWSCHDDSVPTFDQYPAQA